MADDAADGKSIGDGVNVAMRFEVTAMEELEKGNTFNKESAEVLWLKRASSQPAADT